MNDNKKEIRRIRLEDLDVSLQNILLNRISKDDPTWKRITEIINDLYKKTHIEKKNITITITQSANQTIHVYVPRKTGGIDYTSTFTCLSGTAYEVEVIANKGYIAGTLNVSRKGTFNNNKTINATSATKSNATVTITQSANQTIHVYTPKKSGGTDHTFTFTCPVGTTYEAEVIAENGYVAGALNVSKNGIFNSNMTINANPAVKRTQIFVSKGSAPWCNNRLWVDKSHVVNVDESTSGQATVTCDGNVTNMSRMFFQRDNLDVIDLSNFDTSNVTSMNRLFDCCYYLYSINLSNFDTSKVTNMGSMFRNCQSLTWINLQSFDTSNVSVMWEMFYNCSDLVTIEGIIDMKSCTDYGTIDSNGDSRMFANCPKLKGVKIKNPPAGFDGAGLSKSQYTIVS